MKITKVSYGKTYSLGNYCSERIDLEASIDESVESVTDAVFQLREYCDQLHKKNNPHLYQETTPVYNAHSFGLQVNGANPSLNAYETEEPNTKPSIQTYIEQIHNCKSINQLKEWEVLAKSNKQLKEAYELKYQELSK